MITTRQFALGCILAATAAGTPSCAAEQPVAGPAAPLPRVLLIGDSICGGYQMGVRKRLEGSAVVVKNAGNAQHTGTGLEKIDAWLGDEHWDVIHFNWGLWDLAYRNPDSENFGHLDKVGGTITTPLPTYERNLRRLVARLKRTGATLVWASTTPVPDGEPGRIKGDDLRYNAAAARIMAENHVAIDDLHAEVIRLGRPRTNNVHDTGDLSPQVARSILAALAGRQAAPPPGGATAPAAAPAPAPLKADFRKLGFGMFIHYNMATYTGEQWVTGYPDPSTFDPGGRVDTDAWADAAKSAGMKYAVLTAKHVGGFCLWDSSHTTYDVMHPDCPYQQDLVAQFVESFTSRGMKAGLYYCWRHPGFGDPDKHKVLPPECDPARHGPEEQVEFQQKQIAELVARYPEVFYIWNDALDDRVMTAAQAGAFFRGLDRDVLASSNWWDWGRKGTPFVDIAVKEMRHFPESNAAPGETCWKLEQQWFWNRGFRAGNPAGVLGHIATARARNSNFLLNVGPDRQGRIIDSSRRALAEIGRLAATHPGNQ